MRALEESAEAIVVKKSAERQKERRAKEPRESNRPPDFVWSGEKDSEIAGSCNYGVYPVDSFKKDSWIGVGKGRMEYRVDQTSVEGATEGA